MTFKTNTDKVIDAKGLEFDSNARRFLSNKLAKEISRLAKEFEEVDIFMADESISNYELVQFLKSEKKLNRLSEVINRFAPLVEYQISSTMKEPGNQLLSRDDLIKKFTFKFSDCFKGVNLKQSPILKLFLDELLILMRLTVLKHAKNRDTKLNDDVSANIEQNKEFINMIGEKLKVNFGEALDAKKRAELIYERLQSVDLAQTAKEVTLKINENGSIEQIVSAKAIKEKDKGRFDFLTLRLIYEKDGEEKNVLISLSLLNGELNAFGSKSIVLSDAFKEGSAHYQYEFLKYKIFEAIEDAILEDRLPTAESAKNTLAKETKETSERVLTTLEDSPLSQPLEQNDEPTEESEKINTGTKQFRNIKLDAAANAILRFDGVIEVKGTKHNHTRTFKRLVNGKVEKATLMPIRSRGEVQPNSIKQVLERFEISAQEFFDML